MRGDSQGNWGGWSNTFSFSIDTQGPAAPTLLSPANNAVISANMPAFGWSDVSDAAAYELVVDTNNSFTDPIISKTDLTVSHFTAATQLADGVYVWRVRARDNWNN
ncbi:hypothetical protein EH223_20380 [candidate division KSB1 bacterium]|nr:hypothetical protein [candidate division KSB1 bacterium]RQV99860.1 MAG: hypothetical protein EH223_20380 [candidate division KSB1 bacterium]